MAKPSIAWPQFKNLWRPRPSGIGRVLALGLLALSLIACEGAPYMAKPSICLIACEGAPQRTITYVPPAAGPPVRTFPPAAAVTPLPAPVVPAIPMAAFEAREAATASPALAQYSLDAVAVEVTRTRRLFHEITATAIVGNPGGAAESYPLVVEMQINNQDPVTVHVIDGPGPVPPIVATARLKPGTHSIDFVLAGARKSTQVHVAAADLVIELAPYVVTAPGEILVSVDVSNAGEVAAEGVVLEGFLAEPQLGRGTKLIRNIGRLEPGESVTLNYPVAIPAGWSQIFLGVSSGTLEERSENNLIPPTVIWIKYPELFASVHTPPRVRSYEPDGTAIVHLQAAIANMGLSAAPNFSIAVLDAPPTAGVLDGLPVCGDSRVLNCRRTPALGPLGRGQRLIVPVQAALPSGDHELYVVAAPPNDARPLAGERVAEVSVTIAPSATALAVFEHQVEVAGYWSDGSADIRLTGQLPGGDAPAAAVLTCVTDGLPLAGCGGRLDTSRSDAGATFTTVLRVPMGQLVNVALAAADGHHLGDILVEAPERILGVERFVWECYNDRAVPAYLLSEEAALAADATPETCGGWIAPIVRKWPNDHPVRIWISAADAEYLAIANRAVAELDELVDNRIEIVDSKSGANLRLYVGIDRADAFDPTVIDRALQDCLGGGGCADQILDGSGGIEGGQAVCWALPWRDPSWMFTCVLHELLHIVANNVHRDAFDTRSSVHSIVDRELQRLNSHRLLSPGMTMEQVRELVVLEDELLDGAGASSYERLWRAAHQFQDAAGQFQNDAGRLQNAGSVRFEVRGQGAGQSCPAPFGWAHYGLSHISPWQGVHVGHFESDATSVWVNREAFIERDGTWVAVDRADLAELTAWYPEATNLAGVLRQALAYGDAAEFGRTDLPGGDVRLTAAALAMPYWVTLRDVSFTLAGSTGAIVEFAWTIPENAGACMYRIEGRNPEIGVALTPPA